MSKGGRYGRVECLIEGSMRALSGECLEGYEHRGYSPFWESAARPIAPMYVAKVPRREKRVVLVPKEESVANCIFC
jgi:hypothetical protein